MTGLIDPVGVGLIASLARPGNNTTGISNMIQDMSAKGLELIREVAPTAKTIAALFNPNNPGSRLILVLLDAILTCVSRTGIRQLGARDFVLGALTTAL
jgi:ABC-type uncharacterized transport system substrate-binding protein